MGLDVQFTTGEISALLGERHLHLPGPTGHQRSQAGDGSPSGFSVRSGRFRWDFVGFFMGLGCFGGGFGSGGLFGGLVWDLFKCQSLSPQMLHRQARGDSP